MPGAPVGPPNPLPPLGAADDEHEVADTAGLPADMAWQVGYGRLATVLPCARLDSYTRERAPMDFDALVLDNGRLRATVLPGLGGRLISLVRTGPDGAERELLYRNPVFQPANFALNGAWFSGGIEWNIGSTGHTTLSVAPVHAASVPGPDGTPMLRLWEWERTRDLPFQVDLWLPEGSDFLYVGARMRNPHDHEVPAYWWTNIAVPEERGSRVLAPADEAWNFGYTHELRRVPIPVWDGADRTYPLHTAHATDYFYETDPAERHWVASLDERGTGLAQASTARLRGRKLFLWGDGSGCRHWQDWLTDPRMSPYGGYIEIQAGLVRTQLEHLPLPGGEEFTWLEAYGELSADPARVHAADWATARGAAGSALEAALPSASVEAAYARWLTVADAPPTESLAVGSGWGALEIARAGYALPGTPYAPSTLGDEQRPWLTLLREGTFPEADPTTPPGSTLVSAPWLDLLDQAPSTWLTEYHRGVARWSQGDTEGAVTSWKRSLSLADSPWSHRNLAFADSLESRHPEAASHLLPALRQVLARATDAPPPSTAPPTPAARPHTPTTTSPGGGVAPPPSPLSTAVRALARETLDSLLNAGRADDCLHVLAELPAEIVARGRFRLIEVRARTAVGDVAGARAIFDAGFEVEDLHEGDEDVHDAWWALAELEAGRAHPGLRGRELRDRARRDFPLPPRYDLHMRPATAYE
jgi:hypothetical protein